MFNKIASKRIVIWTVFILIDFLVASVIAELWIRSFVPVHNICWRIDSRIGARYCSNQRTYGYVEKGYSNIFITNSLGFHDIERERIKKKGVYRIQLYGESMIGGTQVQINETINAYAEQYLNSQGLPYEVEILNMAAGDESTSSQILTYEDIGRKFQTDMVVCYFMNDFPENVYETHGKIHIPYHKISSTGDLEYIPPVPKDNLTIWEQFKRTSLLYRLSANKLLASKFYYSLKKMQKNIKHLLLQYTKPNDSPQQPYHEIKQKRMVKTCWPLTIRLIKHFKIIAEKDGSQFVLVDGMVFNSQTVGNYYSNKDFEKILKNDNINYISLYPLDSELRTPENYEKHVFKDNHFKSVGNKKIGTELGKRLLEYLP